MLHLSVHRLVSKLGFAIEKAAVKELNDLRHEETEILPTANQKSIAGHP